MTISSRTPEGSPNRCPVCGSEVRVEPSNPPGDAPCPQCGHLLWFVNQRFSDVPEGGSYTRTRLIGRDFGELWAGEGPGGIPVAIQIIPRSLVREDVEVQRQALEVARRVRHPYLLQTWACWQIPDGLVIITELAEGSLRDRLQGCRQAGLTGVPGAELVRYCREAAEGLDYLQGEHVVHRDVKPANLFLFQGHAKVGGPAAFLNLLPNPPGTVVGTLAYMAPELFANDPSPWTDQYALAISYHELRTGRLPFGDESLSPVRLMLAHGEGKLDFSLLPPAEQSVIRKATHRTPDRRYQNCLTFVRELEQALA
jgi:eukaryotic-like serine/threonine-protein kinase